jgi:hypothetical protein
MPATPSRFFGDTNAGRKLGEFTSELQFLLERGELVLGLAPPEFLDEE